jgi:predicted ATP-grasp superfamily ATP-dependent carboligase
MNQYNYILPRLYSNVIRNLFLKLKRFESYLLSKQKIKILFSNKEEWKSDILAGFKFTNHEIVFDDILSCNLKEYDLIVPLTIPDLMYLNEVHELIIDNAIPIPSKKTIELCDDKYLFNQELKNNGFGEFVPTMDNNLRYPYILKKKIDQWGENCHIIFDVQHELNFTDIINSPNYFIQEIIPGKHEYATHILFKNQKILRSLNIMYSFDKEIPIKGKDMQNYTTIGHCPYLDIFSDILTSLNFEGLCCINYKVSDNRPQILEINPRCGGSLCPYLFSFVESAI